MSHSVYVTNTTDRKGNGTHNVSHCLFCLWYLFWWGLLLHIHLRYNQQHHLASVGILTDNATLTTYSYKGIGSTTLQLYPFCNNRSMCYVIVTLVSWDVIYHFERCQIHWKPEKLKKRKQQKKTCICCQHCACWWPGISRLCKVNLFIPVFPDVTVLDSARPSAGTMMNKFWSHIYICMGPEFVYNYSTWKFNFIIIHKGMLNITTTYMSSNQSGWIKP